MPDMFTPVARFGAFERCAARLKETRFGTVSESFRCGEMLLHSHRQQTLAPRALICNEAFQKQFHQQLPHINFVVGPFFTNIIYRSRYREMMRSEPARQNSFTKTVENRSKSNQKKPVGACQSDIQ